MLVLPWCEHGMGRACASVLHDAARRLVAPAPNAEQPGEQHTRATCTGSKNCKMEAEFMPKIQSSYMTFCLSAGAYGDWSSPTAGTRPHPSLAPRREVFHFTID